VKCDKIVSLKHMHSYQLRAICDEFR